MLQRPAAARAQYTESVCIVDDQPRIVALAQTRDVRQRGNVPIHAEDRIGDDDLVRRFGLRQEGFERSHVAVCITPALCTGQYHRGIEGSVIQTVSEDFAGSSRQDGQDGKGGEIAGRKQQRPR